MACRSVGTSLREGITQNINGKIPSRFGGILTTVNIFIRDISRISLFSSPEAKAQSELIE